MRKAVFTHLLCLIFISSFAQKSHSDLEASKIKSTCIHFLKWYRSNHSNLQSVPTVVGFHTDSAKKDDVLHVDTVGVKMFLKKFKDGGYVSDTFLDHLNAIYKNLTDTLKMHPLKNYFGPVPGLESDIIFGFGIEDVFNAIENIRPFKSYRIANKALVLFKLSYAIELVFTLTKQRNWQIDYVGYNSNNKFNIGSQ